MEFCKLAPLVGPHLEIEVYFKNMETAQNVLICYYKSGMECKKNFPA